MPNTKMCVSEAAQRLREKFKYGLSHRRVDGVLAVHAAVACAYPTEGLASGV